MIHFDEKPDAKLQPTKSTMANLVSSEELADVSTLLLMLTVQTVILLAVGQPCLTYGAIVVAVGAVGGFLNQADSGAIEIAMKKLLGRSKRRGAPAPRSDVLTPVMMIMSEDKLTKIDAFLPGKDISKERRRWIMTAIDEKLAREHTPEFPAAA